MVHFFFVDKILIKVKDEVYIQNYPTKLLASSIWSKVIHGHVTVS